MTAYTPRVEKQAQKVLKYIFFNGWGRKSPAGAGPLSLFILAVAVCLIIISVAGFLVVKGKLADFIIHGAVMVQDIGLEVIGEGSAGFRPAWRVGSVLRPVVMAQLGV